MIKQVSDTVNAMDLANLVSHKPLRTQIIGGYDPFPDSFGRTQFGSVAFNKENMIVLGGSTFILEKVFGDRIKKNTVATSVPTIETFITDPAFATAYSNTVYTNDGFNPAANLTADNIVCLFGVGIGGSGDSITDVVDVRYYDAGISDMIPMREISQESDISVADHEKYWVRSHPDGGEHIRFYLKSFESIGIYSKWRDNAEEASGTNVDLPTVYSTSNTTTPIETYIELTLRITRDDVREYFENNASTEISRVNSIALFSGIKRTLDTPVTILGNDQRLYEYDNVKMFSKLNIGNEILTLPKDLTILYRIFTS